MNQAAGHMKSPAQKPENKKNYKDGPKHSFTSAIQEWRYTSKRRGGNSELSLILHTNSGPAGSRVLERMAKSGGKCLYLGCDALFFPFAQSSRIRIEPLTECQFQLLDVLAFDLRGIGTDRSLHRGLGRMRDSSHHIYQLATQR